MPPRRTRLAFPKSVMDKGFTVLPNALDDLGLGPYHYRVLVFIVRWKGKATPEKPSFPIAVEYIATTTGISVSKVKEVIHDLEHEYRLIAVHRRKRLRNLYDIRPLFSVLLGNLAGPKATAPATSVASEAAVEDGGDAEVPVPDMEPEPDHTAPPRPRFGSPRYGDAEVNRRDDDDFDEQPADARLPGLRGFEEPSHAPDDRIYPGEDDDAKWVEEREDEEVREACERAEYVPGLTSIVRWDGVLQVIPRYSLEALKGDPSLTVVRL